jgi:phage gp29-like protein
MATLKPRGNVDRYQIDVTLDLTPLQVQQIFTSANGGNVQRQSKLANEITEKDPAIAQAWNVRVSSIAACPWEIIGPNAEFVTKALNNISPTFDSGLISFGKWLNYQQSAVMHGFAVSQAEYINGGSVIQGFKVYSQSLFSYVDSNLPYYVDPDDAGKKQKTIFFPRWLYHTATNAREMEPLRSGLVRPLAYLAAFRRHVLIEYLRGIEKYGLPLIQANVDKYLYESSTEKTKLENALANMTYDGYMITPKDTVELNFPTAQSSFDVMVFKEYLDYSEKQIFRLILGQDSTSSADNSNRSTAQVHNLVRKDILEADVKAVEETVNNQIIKPLMAAQPGMNKDELPRFRFVTKGVDELNSIAMMAKTFSEAGYDVDIADLERKTGLKITKKEVQNVD